MSARAAAGRSASTRNDRPGGVVTTSRTDDFLGRLQPADVLLFDTLHPLSHLIKLAENRPVNHCALYLGKEQIAHVGRHVPDRSERGAPPLEPAARTKDLKRWLEGTPHTDRTVTALRHRSAAGGDPGPVLARAGHYTDEKNTTYDYLSLLALAVPCLLRTYRDQLRIARTSRLLRASLRSVSQIVVAALEHEARPGRSAHAMSLTCSEFVYRCFDEAGATWSVEVTRPIGRWENPGLLQRGEGGRARPRATLALDVTVQRLGRQKVVGGGGAVAFDHSFRADVLGPASVKEGSGGGGGVAAPRQRGDSVPGVDLAVEAGRVLMRCIERNRLSGKYDGGASRGDVFADLVTPKDLWASPSLSAVAVLHRPPAPADDDLDGRPEGDAAFFGG